MEHEQRLQMTRVSPFSGAGIADGMAGSTAHRVTFSVPHVGASAEREVEYAIADHENPVCGNVDRALLETRADGRRFLRVSGWFYHLHEQPTILQVGVPGSPFVISRRVPREDVASRYPRLPDVLECGFEACLPLVDPVEAPFDVYFLATLPDGLTLSGCFAVHAMRSLTEPPRVVEGNPNVADRLADGHAAIQRTLLRSFLSSSERLRFPAEERPQVSIIIPLFNRAELTLACMRSLQHLTGEAPFEVILVDNASTDETAELLNRLDGAVIIRNDRNRHFIEACNQGARAARGEHLLFLNNDTTVPSGTIRAALSCLKEEDRCGAVGGKIIRLDGTLQEAGSIVWSDGSTLGYGAGDDPARPEYRFRREVDYCSGAFLLTPAALFQRAGEFDLAFSPAYYEDVDYCARLRELGYRVLYEPEAVLIHAEHSSSSPTEARDLQLKNRSVFLERHRRYIERRPRASTKNLLHARSVASEMPRILFIEDRVPLPVMGSGFPRSLQLLEALTELSGEVTFYSAQKIEESWEEIYRVVPRSVEVIADRAFEQLETFLEERPGYYDFIVLSRPHNMEKFRPLWQRCRQAHPATKIIYDAEAVYAVRELLKLLVEERKMLPPEDIQHIIGTEVDFASEADAVLTVSEHEADYFRSKLTCPVLVTSFAGSAAPGPASFEERANLVTVGPVHKSDTPNGDANLWFAREILPRLSQLLEGRVRFDIAGLNRSIELKDQESPQLHLLGPADDLAALLNRYRIFVAPTRFSAGIPLKVISAALHGIPVVATPTVATQLGWTDGRQLLVGRTAEDFARKCAELYTSPGLWTHLRDTALSTATRQYTPTLFKSSLRQALEAASQKA